MTTIRELREEKLRRILRKRVELSQGSFWEYCKTIAPDFYKEGRWYLKLYCQTLQALYDKELTKERFRQLAEETAPKWFMNEFNWTAIVDDVVFQKLMINMPPRHGKSRTLILFCQWVLGKDKLNKIITTSYNEDLATDFSRYTRDGIGAEKAIVTDIVFSDIFPDVRIKKGDASYRQWALEGCFFTYKGAGLGGSITGKGGNILIVDDPVKNAEEAFNDNTLEKQWTWYTGTFLSRLEEAGERPVEIINMTRWAKKDLCGRILDGDNAKEWFVLHIEVQSQTGEMLCEELLSRKRYAYFKKEMNEVIFLANYHQRPVDVKGKLYKSFKTYEDVPKDSSGHPLFEKIINYTDTADDGNDYLCSITAGVYQGEGYVLDILYTKEGMEVTEPQTADFLVENNVNIGIIESNNGGKGFARNVQRLIWERHKTKSVAVKWFHQSKNKAARILTNSTFVMNHLYFPVNWKDRWPEYYAAMNSYQKEGKNAHDDAPDCTTGIAELINGKRQVDTSDEEKKKERKRKGLF